ncbi:GGDEF domain-containing protein [Vibrio astriarenae]|uniref:GGDEF domain-containing protein n=1 Tax=Vibrio astriarenae TaxID=1481923 RepID=UPI003735F144
MRRELPTINIRVALIVLVASCTLLPLLYLSHYFTDTQVTFLQEQKTRQLNNTDSAVLATIRTDVTRLLDTVALYSADRFVIQATNNILYSSPMQRKINDFIGLTDIDATVYFADRGWDIAYEASGSVYHFENSGLIKQIMDQQAILSSGLGVTLHYQEPLLVDAGEGRGVAFVAPLLPFTLEKVSQYEPQGYIIILIDYKSLSSRVKPLLLEEESIEFRPPHPISSVDGHSVLSRNLTINHPTISQPFELQLIYSLSDTARTEQLTVYQNQMRRVVGVVFLVSLALVWLVNHLFSRQFSRINQVVLELSRGGEASAINRPFKYVFSELRNIERLIKAQRSRISLQVAELKSSNLKLEEANITIANKNQQLETFNARLEEQVVEKTKALQQTLNREARHSKMLDRILQNISDFSSVGYRGLPQLVQEQLTMLFEFEVVKFTYQRHEGSHLELLSSFDKVQGHISHKPLLLKDEEQVLMDIYCQQLASWIELERIGRCDGLTHSLNRLAFDDDFNYLKQKLENGEIGQFALVVVDINGLKPVNDHYGHELGDKLIIACCKLLQNTSFTNVANVYRVGGDEFVMLLPDVSEGELHSLQRQLEQAQMGAEVFDEAGHAHRVSFSIGVVHSDDHAPNDMFQIADDEMYRSKHLHYHQASPTHQ